MKLVSVAAGAGLLYLATRRHAPAANDDGGDVSVTVGVPLIGMAVHAERLAGVHPQLRNLALGWPGLPGRSRLLILPDGGLRTDPAVQEDLYRRGASKAEKLIDTAHGRGVGLDAYVLLDGENSVDWTDDEGFALWGEYAEAAGLVWGGRWATFRDAAHAELANWRSYPYPSHYA